MRIVLIDTSYPINSRNVKIIESLKKYFTNAEVHIITWDRNGTCKENIPLVYKKKSPTGNQLMKLLNINKYRQFVYQSIKEINPDIVIASHWDSLLITPKLNKQRTMLIYENLDIPTGRFRFIIRCIERWKLRHVDLIIHASRFFKQLYSPRIEQIVLENKPVFSNTDMIFTEHQESALRLTWIGTVRYKEILYNLINVVKDYPYIKLIMHGDGPDYSEIKAYTSKIPNITMTGGYNYEEVKYLYKNSDIVWAAYPNKDYNVKYAISNKFHESLIMLVPCIFASDTKLGDMVLDNKIGLCVNPYSKESIRIELDKIMSGETNLMEIKQNILKWNKTTSSWEDDFIQIIKKIELHFS